MKKDQKGIGKIGWEQMEVASRNPVIGFSIKKLTGTLAVVVCITYFIYSLNLLFLNNYGCGSCLNCKINCTKSVFAKHFSNASGKSVSLSQNLTTTMETLQPKINVTKTGFKTDLQHIVFGIAASSKLWERRRDYIRLWWNPREMRGFVWLDENLKNNDSNGKNGSFPPIQISENTSHFKYTNKEGHRSALRISRIVSETFRLGLPDVHWFVMGDDDTVFVAENLVRVLSKYDHRQMYYIGSLSESHLQNLHFSYNMAYGGGGFAISYPLARALEKVQDSCMQRYPGLYGSDDRVQACMAELGVPLTREPGFHQYDIYGNLFGLLAAHPVTPLVTLHHLDVVEPIFPNKTRIQALQHLFKAVRLDSAGILQQSICYDSERQWSISVSWGYAVQIFRGIFPPRDLETPSRTFLNWYKRADYTAYSFNTRPVTRHPCQKPFVFFLKDIHYDRHQEVLISKYTSHDVQPTVCRWKMASPESVKWIQVTKKPQTYSVTQAPRRNCCRIVSSNKTSVHAEVGPCKQGEIIGL